MKRHIILGTGVFLASAANFGLTVAQSAQTPPPPAQTPAPPVQVWFSPLGGCTAAVVKELGAATTSVDVEAYDFSSLPIARALSAAHGRGVKVRVVIDRLGARQKKCVAPSLQTAGIPVVVDGNHAIFHDKVMVIDGAKLLTGSFNFTQNAENRNAENLLVLSDVPDLAAKYEAEFERHRAHSLPLATEAP